MVQRYSFPTEYAIAYVTLMSYLSNRQRQSPRRYDNHTCGIYRCYVQDHNNFEFARFQVVSNRASSKRLYYVVSLYPPFLLYHADVITHKKARCGTRHGRIKTKCTNTRSLFIHSKITIFFTNKRKETKENAQTGSKNNSKQYAVLYFLAHYRCSWSALFFGVGIRNVE